MSSRFYDPGIRASDFERLFAEHAQPLFRFLLYRTQDYELSEDLVAETFERLLRTTRRFDPRRASERTWIYTIALNVLRDHARRGAAEARALERLGAPPADVGRDVLAAVPLRDEVLQGLATLATDEREALALRYGADLTVPEIARLLDVPLTTVESRIYRGLRKLRSLLGAHR